MLNLFSSATRRPMRLRHHNLTRLSWNSTNSTPFARSCRSSVGFGRSRRIADLRGCPSGWCSARRSYPDWHLSHHSKGTPVSSSLFIGCTMVAKFLINFLTYDASPRKLRNFFLGSSPAGSGTGMSLMASSKCGVNRARVSLL